MHHYYVIVRHLGVDIGRRRVGLALSDPSSTIARPWRTIPAGGTALASARAIVRVMTELTDPLGAEPPIGTIVVGLPRRLDGSSNESTADAEAIAAALRSLTGLPVHFQDERLTSREAERLLAEREPDWRRRKPLVDAAAAALILQDFLDARVPPAATNGLAGA
jgi:putative Holliday junction resolvase